MKAGDLVTLKSGGPHMTVARVLTGEIKGIYCKWFNKKDEVMLELFQEETLSIVKDGQD